jgi:pilus assembly protein FimV
VSAGASEYGPVVAYDTAWSIAKKVRPSGVSMEQMMMSLLNANPQAFIDGNINRLRKGQILRVPSLSEIQELSRQQARQAYREQQDQWLVRRDEKLQSAAESEQAEVAAEQPVADSATDPDDQLKIATARPEGEGEAGAGDDDAVSATASDLNSRLIVARENAETSRQEAETLRSQVDDLQARLENMQKLLSLKDDQLAQLQDRVVTEDLASEETAVAAATGTQEPTADADVADAAASMEQAAGQVEQAVETEAVAEDYRIQDIPPQVDPDQIVANSIAEATTEAASDEIVVAPEGGDSEIVIETGQEPVTEVVIEAPVSEPVVAEQEVTRDPVVESVVEPVAAETEPQAAPRSPWMSMVEENMVPIAVGGVSLLALFGWLAARGRRKDDEGAEPVLAAAAATAATATAATATAGTVAPTPEEVPEPAVVDEPALNAEALSDLPDSTFLDEFSPSDINALQDETGEVDPVSEADVYIAYGRYQQAEEMLKQAMSKDPDRLALKHKLLEVHYATKNAGAFAILAQEMVDAGQDAADEAAWARAKDMGRELAPDNPLFAFGEGDADVSLDEEVPGASAMAAVATAAAGTIDSDTLALDDLELSELTAEFDDERSPAEDLEAPSEVSITLDLDAPSGFEETNEPELPETIQLDEIEALGIEMPKAEPEGVAADMEDTISDSLDLDSMMAEAEAAVDAGDSTLSLDSEFSADELQAQLDELSDLSILDSDLEEAPASGAVEPPAGLGLVEEDSGSRSEGLVDEPVNLDTAFDVVDGEDDSADVLEIGEVTAPDETIDEDEVATKLDLARAYVEMGDEDGARAILEEVAAEGSQAQRGDAETLLSQLG